MVVDTTLYDLLEVNPSATDGQIKKNYHRLAKKYHPDKNSTVETSEKFKEIQFAYEVLSDSSKKSMYDRYGLDAVKEGGSSSAGGFEDVFGHFFGSGGGGMGGGHPFEEMFSPFGGGFGGGGHMRGPRKGKDVLHPLKVTLEDLYKGKTSKIQLNKTVNCRKCNGQGGKHGTTSQCQECKGRGIVIKIRQLGPGMVQQMRSECNICNGEGTLIADKDKCKTCNGRKVVKEIKILEVPIEKGSRHEQKIRFSGEGDQQPGVEPGDVIIVLAEQQHDNFNRKGDNLIHNVKVTLSEALCGFNKVIKHLDGRDIVLSRPMGKVVETNGLYIINGEGMPKYRDPYTKGDLYVTCDIEFPERIEDIEKLERLLPTRPVYNIPENDDNVEEVDMIDYDGDTNAGPSSDHHHQGYAGGGSDSDDDDGGPRVQQCATA